MSDTERGVEERPMRRPPRVIAVAGAKGGVGKTTVATNLALCLSTLGRKVVLLDADRLGGNVHTALGMERPSGGAAVRRGPAVESDLALHATAYPDLKLALADVDDPRAGIRNTWRYSKLPQLVSDIDAAHVVVDLGDGCDAALLDNFLWADFGLYVCTPDPAAVENVARFIKALFLRRLKSLAGSGRSAKRWQQRLKAMHGPVAPRDFVQRLVAENDPMVPQVQSLLETLVVPFIVNQARVRQDVELGQGIRSAVRRQLGATINYLGYISHDETIWMCTRKRRPLMVESPGSKASRAIEKIIRRMMSGTQRLQVSEHPVPSDSYFDLLEIGRGATDEEVRRAFKRMRAIYGADALPSYGLMSTDERQAMQMALEEAYEVLLDPARRQAYEQSLFPETEQPMASEPPEPRPNVAALEDFPELGPDTQYTGALLRAIREAQGVDLMYISRRTKIGLNYLRAIEEERYDRLPEKVYVRGYVSEFAKLLRLDPMQVSRTYVRAMDQNRGHGRVSPA